MIQTLRRGANAVLFVIACLLAADTANAVFAAIVLPPPQSGTEAAAVEPVATAAWTDRQAILDRNVFESSTLAPPVEAKDVDEELEATQLPLTLLGTAASEDPRFAWAAVQDRDQKSTLILGIGGSIADKATVVRIERRRVVLLEGGVHRELKLDEEDLTPQLASTAGGPGGAAARRATAISKAQERRQQRMARLAENAAAAGESFNVPAEDIQAAIANPAELFSQARILPKYEEGQMRGVQISQIKPGSLFEQMGLQEGDLVTEINGIPIDSPEQSAAVLQQFSQGVPLQVGVTGADGQTRTYTTNNVQR